MYIQHTLSNIPLYRSIQSKTFFPPPHKKRHSSHWCLGRWLTALKGLFWRRLSSLSAQTVVGWSAGSDSQWWSQWDIPGKGKRNTRVLTRYPSNGNTLYPGIFTPYKCTAYPYHLPFTTLYLYPSLFYEMRAIVWLCVWCYGHLHSLYVVCITLSVNTINTFIVRFPRLAFVARNVQLYIHMYLLYVCIYVTQHFQQICLYSYGWICSFPVLCWFSRSQLRFSLTRVFTWFISV